jgi:DNA-binding response OmpR family regulator
LPKKDGRKFLREITENNYFKNILIVVVTISGSEKNIFRVYDLHAMHFTKPIDFDQFITVVESIGDSGLKL